METRYTGEPTLDEPVSKTIVRYSDPELAEQSWADEQMRDLTSIYQKLLQVLYPPKGNGTNQLLRSVFVIRSDQELMYRDWDLWGPLVICLSLAIVLSIDVSQLART